MSKIIRRTSVTISLFVAILLILASCSSSQLTPNGQTPAPQTSKQKTAAPPPVTVEIIFDMGQAAGPGIDVYKGDFKPQTIYIPVGTTVVWENKENFLMAKHSVTSKDGLFDNELNVGESFNYTFTKTGTFDYNCKFYPIMTGEIVIE